ncbi:DctP family TRAP transporter solute-binding subunit [Cohaesibacter haloalkalitolerans]|uniref:DctP family TRAP transporter solute-binding subunit n=1 Tax=Cohaesibacter haloalkalitolerans TaxID=1162980 RepID=UPI000E650E32|nr:DctP family TRAP transporter solute-binding subunit [Cohaesibacter haloalkalitolerans]
MSFKTLTLAAVLAVGTIVSPAVAETLRFSNVTSVSGKDAGVEFKRIVEEKTGGSLEVKHFPDNQLGNDRVITESTIFGDIDIGVSSTSPLATLFPDLYAFDAPFLFLSSEDAYAKLDGETGQAILKTLEKKGLKGLAFWENGFRNFTNSKKAVAVPADLSGMKIRTMENDVHLAAWRALGANPTPMAFSELFTALQQGTVDGQENPLGIIDGNRFQEVQSNVSLTQHVYTPYIVFMNLDKFNSLSDVEKDAIVTAAKETTAFQRKRSQELETEILARIKDQGVTVTELTAEQKALWQKTVVDAKIYDLVKSKMDHPEYMDAFLKK